MAVPESTDRKVLEALEAYGAELALAGAVMLFEGSPFDVADQGTFERGASLLAIGAVRDPAGLRTGKGTRAFSRMLVGLVVLVPLGGRDTYRTDLLGLVDLSAAVVAGFEVLTSTEIETRASLAGGSVLGVEIGDVEVLADPAGNFGARSIPLSIRIKR